MYLCFFLLLCSRHHVTFSIQTINSAIALFVHQNVFIHWFLTTEQCCGSGMFISDPNFFHPGSRDKKIPGSASTSKNLSIVTPKTVSELSEISGMFNPDADSGSGSIPDPDFDSLLYPSWMPVPGSRGSKRHRIPDPDPQHCYGDNR
jgi:hypothetical protein